MCDAISGPHRTAYVTPPSVFSTGSFCNAANNTVLPYGIANLQHTIRLALLLLFGASLSEPRIHEKLEAVYIYIINNFDHISTSIVDKNDRLMFQSQRQTRQHSTDRYVVHVRVLHA